MSKRSTACTAVLDGELRTSLVHLPSLLYAPLLERNIAPQSLVVELVRHAPAGVSDAEARRDTVYCGWSGLCAPSTPAGAGSSSSAPSLSNSLSVSPLLARSFEPPLASHETLSLVLLRAPPLPTASSINVTPCGPDDWEVLARHAGEVEDGMLAQVRAAKQGAVIHIAVGKGDSVSMRVDTTSPPTSGESGARAVRLSTSTEVIIAPVPRAVVPPPASASSPSAAEAARSFLARTLFRAVPCAGSAMLVPPSLARTLRDAFGEGQRASISTVACPAAPELRPGLESREADSAKQPTRNAVWVERDAEPEARDVWVGQDTLRQLGAQGGDMILFSAPSPVPLAVPAEVPSAPLPSGDLSLPGLDLPLKHASAFFSSSLRSSALLQSAAGALHVTGPSGSGKATLAAALLSALAPALAPIRVRCSKHADVRPASLRKLAAQWVAAAAWHAPSVLWLQDVERLAPQEMEHADGSHSRACAEALVAALEQRPANVLVLLTSSGATHSILTASRLVAETLQLRPPDKNARKAILDALINSKVRESNGLQAQDLNLVSLANETEGFFPNDLKDLTERAVTQAAIRSAQQDGSHSLTQPDFDLALDGFVPLSLRDVKLEKSSVAWSDIGGLVETRQVLRETLEWPTKYAAIFAGCPLRLRSGLLLYGYPGCGKTLLASAVAKECGLNFIAVKGPEILNKYIGASEKSVRDLFDRAQAAKPCVLFFDEFDSIAPKRGHDSTGVTDRVVNQLLTQMDGAEGLSGVYVLAATSRPDLIDSALLRPGRLDKSLLCDMPSVADRLDILKAVSRKVSLSPAVDLQRWAQETDGMSGADLQALLYNAHLETIHASIAASARPDADDDSTSKTKAGERGLRFVDLKTAAANQAVPALSNAERTTLTRRLERMLDSGPALPSASPAEQTRSERKAKVLVTDEHIARSLKTTRPSVPREEQERLRRIYAAFAGERDAVFPSGEASQEIGARESLM